MSRRVTDKPLRSVRRAATWLIIGLAGAMPAQLLAAASYSGSLQTDTYVAEIRDDTGALLSGVGEAFPDGLTVSAGTAIDVFLDAFGSGVQTGDASGEVHVGGGIIPGNGPLPAVPNVLLVSGGDGTSQVAQVAGNTVPNGLVFGDIFTDGVFGFSNTTAAAFQVVIGIDYSWSASISIDDPFHDFALLDVIVEAGLADLSDPDGIAIVTELFSAAVFLDPPFDDTFSDSAQVSFTVGSGETVYFATFSDLSGAALSIPVPGTWLLFGCALPALGLRARRRR